MDNIQITKKTKTSKANSDRPKLIAAVKALKKGQCIEYRGNYSSVNTRSLVGQANEWLGLKYSARAVEGGIDIFCE